MQTHTTTTPFGRRPMSLGQILNQAVAREMPKDAVVQKWQVFQHIREAKDLLGATDRSLAILNALLSFHREGELSAAGDLIVWPSNELLSARANGMPPTTLRRHLAVLVDCGLIIRRDSPNGKRYARKGRGGQIEQAFGFDLSPIVARAEEFEELAATVQTEKKAFRVAKERLTILRRDVVKMVDTGIDENVPANWGRVQQAYQAIIGRLPRTAPRQLLEAVCDEMQELWTEVRDVLESFAKSQNPDANESHSGRHIQNSNTEPTLESEQTVREKNEVGGSAADTHNVRSLPRRDLPLGIVLDACPDLHELAKGGAIRNWRELMATTETARPMLGISPSAWAEALQVLGERDAAITLASIYQRSGQINNAGGYLRSLTQRARDGKFSTWPMVMALLRAKLDEGKLARSAEREMEATNAGEGGGSGAALQVSAALLRSLGKDGGK
ncbi:replication initiation protein RepC [Aquamicrobium sp. NLF2-7]|uniref:plasmid replication protein RepC n=1 Tax=Aquamicrobium sp. NLF2-7 TaxID=2918753 RepID=UPI001EFBC766|nr:plasmid replication protein RepC [Aquamicrobium sp. NLF2-7]MCG8273832.1 replication initiation protein RepC [Aquamicrobium sp. NLF2-7]